MDELYFAVVTPILLMLFCHTSRCSEVPFRVLCAHAQICLHTRNFAGSLKVFFVETDAWDFFFFVCVHVGICESYFSTIYLKTVLLCDWVVCKWFAIVSLFKVPQKQTVPVAPRARISPEESQLEVIHGQSRLPVLSSQLQVEESKDQTVEEIQGHLIIFFKNLY